MTSLAPTLQAFFTERMSDRGASPHTIASYRDAFRLLIGFASQRVYKPPCKLDIGDLDAQLVGAFLTHLETDRHNSTRTRNNRLAAIHSLFNRGNQHPPTPPRPKLRRPPPPRTRGVNPAGARHSPQTLRAKPCHLPERHRSGRTPGGLRSADLDRAARPRHADTRYPDRAADLRTTRPHLRRRRGRHRSKCSHHRQRPEGTAHPAPPPNSGSTPRLAGRAPRNNNRCVVPDQHRQEPKP
jgi:Phage integrase, N-terminal SAM-like domain